MPGNETISRREKNYNLLSVFQCKPAFCSKDLSGIPKYIVTFVFQSSGTF